MSVNDIDNNQKGGAPAPPPFGGEQPTPPTFNEGENTPTPPAFGAPKSAPTPPPVPASAKAEAEPVAEKAEEMTTSSKKKSTKSAADKPKKKKGCVAKGCMWSFIVFLFLGVIGVVFGEDESNKPVNHEASTAQVEQTTAADDNQTSAAITSRKPFTGSVLGLAPSHRYVNDYACILPDSTVAALEDSLAMFSRTTSNQITILTVLDLEGLTPNEFATKIGDTWGVGQKKLDNGLVILFKPKTSDSKGEVYIAPGRGLEGALPDAFCNRVIQHEMIPHLKAGNNYTAATWAALKVIMPVCRGEFTYDNYQKKHYADGEEKEEGLDFWGWTLIIFTGALILFFVVDKIFLHDYFSDKWGLNSTSGSDDSDSSSSSDSSSYSSSSDSSDWDDWGGGSFGGGGAGGSW